MPARAEKAVELFRRGYAPEVWITKPESPAAELGKLGITYAGEEDYNRHILTRGGVPASVVRILPNAIVDTEEEVTEVARELRAENKEKRDYCHFAATHTPRESAMAKTRWRRAVGNRTSRVGRSL